MLKIRWKVVDLTLARFALNFYQDTCHRLIKVVTKLILFLPTCRIIHVLSLLVLARKTLNQTLKQVKNMNVVATADKHQEVKFRLLYNEELHWDSNGGYSVVE